MSSSSSSKSATAVGALRATLPDVFALPSMSSKDILSVAEVTAVRSAREATQRAQEKAASNVKATAEKLAKATKSTKKAASTAHNAATEAYQTAKDANTYKTKLVTLKNGSGALLANKLTTESVALVKAKDGSGIYLMAADKNGYFAVRLDDAGSARLTDSPCVLIAGTSTDSRGSFMDQTLKYHGSKLDLRSNSRDKGNASRLAGSLLPAATVADKSLDKVRASIATQEHHAAGYIGGLPDDVQAAMRKGWLAAANEQYGTSYSAEDLQEKPADTNTGDALPGLVNL